MTVSQDPGARTEVVPEGPASATREASPETWRPGSQSPASLGVTLDQSQPGLAALRQSESVTRPALAEVNTLGRCCCGHSGITTRSSWEMASSRAITCHPPLPHGHQVTSLGIIKPEYLSPVSLGALLQSPAREASFWLPSVRQLQVYGKRLSAGFFPASQDPANGSVANQLPGG